MITYPKAALPSRSISTGSIVDKFRAIARWGFSGVSVLPQELVRALAQLGPTVIEDIGKTGLKLLVHGAIGAAGRPGFEQEIAAQIEITRTFQEKTGNVANFCFDPGCVRGESGMSFSTEASVRALGLASGLWADCGVEVGIENWPCGPFIPDLEEVKQELVGLPVRFLLDVGHVLLAQKRGHLEGISMSAFVEGLPLPICEIHVHDNDGTDDTHWTLGDGAMDMGELAEALRVTPGECWVTIESRPNGQLFPIEDTNGFEAAVRSVQLVESMLAGSYNGD